MEKEADLQVHTLVSSLAVSEEKLAEIQRATQQDPELQKIQHVIKIGWPNHRRNLDYSLKPYWEDQEEYHTAEGIIFKGNRIVVPTVLRAEMIAKIHEGHLGSELCKRRAKQLLFWPGMLSQIADKVTKCATCQRHSRKQQTEPLKPRDVPNRPWQNTASDLFVFHCKDYLLIVDAYSGYFEIEMLEDTLSSTVIRHLKKVFARHGIPEQLLTDNGPQYSSRQFKNFADNWGFVHNTSSPLYPRSNGLAERTVQTVKNILKKAKEDGKDVLDVLFLVHPQAFAILILFNTDSETVVKFAHIFHLQLSCQTFLHFLHLFHRLSDENQVVYIYCNNGHRTCSPDVDTWVSPTLVESN